jgi:Polyketide cyclase / dehydrase and lipid transport
VPVAAREDRSDHRSTQRASGATFVASNRGERMAGGTFTTTIQVPLERVWAVVSDIGTHGSWSPKEYAVEWVTGQPNQVGSTFHSVGWGLAERSENTSEITERVEPTRFAFRSIDPQGVFLNEYDLRPAGDATEVAFTVTFPKMHGMAALTTTIVFPLIGRPNIVKRLAMLKNVLEGRS